jgi:hypothetical protein
MKAFSTLLGFTFLGVGLALTVGLILAIQQGQLMLILGLPVVLMALTLGILTLRYLSVETSCDADGLTLQFPFRQQRVAWDEVLSYKNIGYRGKLNGGANIWVVLRYQIAKAESVSSFAILLLPGEGPVVSFTSKEYTTALNRFIPDRDKTSRMVEVAF